MKIATMATGGIGGFLAVHLARAGHDVAAIARGDHLRAIREQGLRLETSDGTTTVHPRIATDRAEDVGHVDAVMFGVKCDDLESAAEACRPMLGPETAVVPFLNGVEAAERLAAILPPENVANGVAYVSTTVAGPGLIRQTGTFNRFVFGERDSASSRRIEALRSAVEDSGIDTPATDDIDREVWSKFVLFAAVSGVTAAARCTMADILETPPLARLFRDVIGEVGALARARGIALPATIEEETWKFACGLPAAMRASTAIDLEHGRPLEIDWISGAVSRLSEKAGLDAPASRALYALLAPYREGSRSSS